MSYPDTPLRPQVRPLSETFSGFQLLLAAFKRIVR